MGSQSDSETAKEAIDLLKEFKISFEVEILPAHRTPKELVRYVEGTRERGMKIFIAIAGGAAALPGVIAVHTSLPVIGVSVETKPLKGLDSLLSVAQMQKEYRLVVWRSKSLEQRMQPYLLWRS